jgi:hypothetical protein
MPTTKRKKKSVDPIEAPAPPTLDAYREHERKVCRQLVEGEHEQAKDPLVPMLANGVIVRQDIPGERHGGLFVTVHKKSKRRTLPSRDRYRFLKPIKKVAS